MPFCHRQAVNANPQSIHCIWSANTGVKNDCGNKTCHVHYKKHQLFIRHIYSASGCEPRSEDIAVLLRDTVGGEKMQEIVSVAFTTASDGIHIKNLKLKYKS